MKAAIEGVMARIEEGVRRGAAAVRRHPWRTVLALPAAVLVYVLALYPFTPSIGDIKKAKQEQPSIVLSADGKELAVFKRANRDWVKLSDISPKVTEALLATEDKRFYEHPGIDFVRTAKAMVNTLRGDREGGSTITQQLARNLYPEQIGRAPTLTRKVKEAITALKIEAVYSKDEILETYLNSVSFLYNAWGIEMAARTYFDKPARELNELEAATLIGMLKGTAYYNPVMNPERALERRNTVLAMMVKENKLAEDRFEKLKKQPLKLDFERVPEFSGPAPHLAEYLRRWLIQWADDHDYNIYADGLVVRTTIDSRLQEMANEAVARQGKAVQAVADVEWSRSAMPALGSDPSAYAAASSKAGAFDYFWSTHQDLLKEAIRESAPYRQARESGKTDGQALEELRQDAKFMADLRRQKTTVQAGFLAIEPNTGYVKAWVGSRDFADDKFDHVQQARRQPGSTFKPFVYGAAFEMGMSPADTLMDAPVDIQIDKNKYWRPTDIHGVTNQPMTLRDGLAQSKNTITAQLMMRVGPSRVASLARAMGVRESKLDEVPSLALGTSPVTLKEIVTAFGTIANGGNYVQPTIVTAVEDRQHNVLATFGTHAPEQALSNQAAMTLLDVMRGVIDGGTAASLRPRFGLAGDLAGKTGTTQDNTDGWFIVMHPQLVAGAWMGFNDARVTMRSEYWGQGAHNALLVVGDFMQQGMKSKVIDTKATFAAPRLKDQEQPVMQRMGDWWNSVFNTPAPASSDTEVATVPEVKLEPPVLEPAPASVTVPEPQAGGSATAAAEAPVAAGTQPERVPSFPRALDSGRPVDTIPGTQVYRSTDASARGAPDPSAPVDVVRGPSRSTGRSADGSASTATSSSGNSGSSGPLVYTPGSGTSAMGAGATSSPGGSGSTSSTAPRSAGTSRSGGTASSSTGTAPANSRGTEPTVTYGSGASSSLPSGGTPPTASGSTGVVTEGSARRERPAGSSTGSGSSGASSMGAGSGTGSGSTTGSSGSSSGSGSGSSGSGATVPSGSGSGSGGSGTAPDSGSSSSSAPVGEATGSASAPAQ